jgi:SAM-dependent methyltransferase
LPLLALRIIGDNLKAFVPFKDNVRQALRRLMPYRSNLGNDRLALEAGLQLIRFVREYDVRLECVLEVGTGWIPTIPHMLKAVGAERLILTDIERLSDSTTFRHAEDLVLSAVDRIAAAGAISEQAVLANLAAPGSMEMRCPSNTQDLAANSVDLIYSRTVLEHIPRPPLVTLLDEWYRLLAPGGFAIHFIDNSDHFEHRDKSLSRLNFLTMSDSVWKFACFNQQNYQNRMRHSDYLVMFDRYEVVHVDRYVYERALADLKHLRLNPAFAHYDNEDLATLSTTIVLRKPTEVKR